MTDDHEADPGTGPRYAIRPVPRAGYEGNRIWGPYDQDRQRFIGQAVTQANAQDLADRLNASGIDWTYSDDNPPFGQTDFDPDGPAD